jgi:hypothetical protein
MIYKVLSGFAAFDWQAFAGVSAIAAALFSLVTL